MQLETSRFGVLTVDDNAIVTFTQPIIGFQEFRRFVLLDGPKDRHIYWLQSTEAGDLAFILMDPRTAVPNYAVKLGKFELTELAVTSEDELEIYTLLVVPRDGQGVRTNLRAPILINRKLRLGKQTVLEKSDYPIRYELTQSRPTTEGEAQAASGGSPC